MDSLGEKSQHLTALPSTFAQGMIANFSFLLAVCLLLAIAGCGGSGSNQTSGNSPFAGNWQFNLTPPTDGSFTGDPNGASTNSVLQGGFLVQSDNSITGQAVFSIWVTPTGGTATECNSGIATITGTVSGQTVSLTATVGTLVQDPTTGNYVPGTQTFALSGGQLQSDGSIGGSNATYSSTAGFYFPPNSMSATQCGNQESGLSWSATPVPPITGLVQGFFHSTGNVNPGLEGQVFTVTGSFSQGENIGASTAAVTGALTFANYPCVTNVAVNGQISGSSVVLQLFNAANGSHIGQLGGSSNGGPSPVTFVSTPTGYVLRDSYVPGTQTFRQDGYAISNTSGCPGSGLNSVTAGDTGNVCLALGAPNPATGATACSEPIIVSPASWTFAPELLASGPGTPQVITVTNNQSTSSLTVGVTLQEFDSGYFYTTSPTIPGGDFNGLANFSEQDNCSGSSILPQQSCTISISFAPQQSCPWIPSGSVPAGLAPAKCPGLFNPLVLPKNLLSANLIITIPSSSTPDGDNTYAIPIKGVGLSALVPTPAELDFGAEDPTLNEMSTPQTVTFTNQSAYPVQILNQISTFGQTCNSEMTNDFTLPRPPAGVPGLVVVATNGTNGGSANNGITAGLYQNTTPTVLYKCDFVQTSGSSSFQITADGCSGMLLNPGETCSLSIVYAPQAQSLMSFPDPNINGGLDYFLQLNTQQCDLDHSPPQPPPSASNPCEIDSGRFPVELTANPPSPLRMAPDAGLEFGTWLRGTPSTPLTITLTNEQVENQTITFTGNALTGTDYLETNNCPAVLSPGGSCQLTFTFTPSISGFDSANLTIGYNTTNSSGTTTYNLTQYIYLRGFGQ